MQQGGEGEGGGGHQSQFGEMSGPTTGAASSSHMLSEQSEQLVEEASPISSRPPATGSLDEFMRLASGVGDEGGGEDEADRPGGGGGVASGVASGNRWPREETLALLKIRSDMDATFRDATVKGPLWEDVSRKLAELGYNRSAKKCREKFENLQKYYKRTKEGRAGRQHGKSYKFFSELEALHATSATAAANLSTSATAASLDVGPVSVGIPMPISSVRIPPTTAVTVSSMLPMPGSDPVTGPPPAAPITTTAAAFGIGFSSNSSSSSQGFKDDDDDDEDELAGEPLDMAGTSRKRRRQSSRGGGSTTSRMIEFFEVLMKQVMQKQEAMQQRFLEAIEKRERDRMIREEAWKRQEMARLTREQELMAQERAIAASRDDAIISLLQKITGQTIQIPTTTVTIPTAPTPPTQPAVPVVLPADPIPAATPPTSLPQQQQQQPQQQEQQQSQSHSHHQHQRQPQVVQHQQHHPQNTEVLRSHKQPVSSEVVMAIPEQQVPPEEIGGSGSLEPASSRWPKDEVLALIDLRSGLESRYQEVGPKGPLWEEISVAMLRMGYMRSAKRCKEKWENINKYFKKVKESNKKRPEDAKTCPYFHQLDALYRQKILGGGTSGGSSSFSHQNRPEEEASQQHHDTTDAPPTTAAPQMRQPTDQSESETGATVEGNGLAAKKTEDTLRELMKEQGMHQQQHHQGQSLLVDGYDKIDEPDSDIMDQEEFEDEDEDDEKLEEERKMAYKIEFQRQNASIPSGGGNRAPSFLAVVQ